MTLLGVFLEKLGRKHLSKKDGCPRVVVSTARSRSRRFERNKMFLPHPPVKLSMVGSLRDWEVACSASHRQGSNFESCVWRTVSGSINLHCFNASILLGTPEIGLQQTIPVPRWLENPIDLREVEPLSGQCRLTVCYTGPILTQYVRNMQHREPITINFIVIELG